MKKYIYVLLFLLIGLLLRMVFMAHNKIDKIYVDREKSYFSDYEIKNDKVLIKCHITLTNTFKIEKMVNLSAKLPDDVTLGLLKSEEVQALNEDGLERLYILPANASKTFDVVFIGEYAGTDQKKDRNLPDIDIKIVK